MTTRTTRLLLALLVALLLPVNMSAQFGDLKKKLADKVVDSKPAESKAPTQWKQGERVPPFGAKDLDHFMAQWKAELEYRGLPEKEQERVGQQ